MIAKYLPRLLCIAFFFQAAALFGESADEKLQAYQLAIQSRERIERALVSVSKAIEVAKAKVKSYQDQVDSGIASAKSILDLYKNKLDEIEDNREATESKLKQLNSLIEELKKDPDIEVTVTGDEASRDMQKKLDEASALLPKGS